MFISETVDIFTVVPTHKNTVEVQKKTLTFVKGFPD